MAKGFQAGTINTTLKMSFDKAAMNEAVKDVERNMQLMSTKVGVAGKSIQRLVSTSVMGLGGSLAAAFAFGARAAVVFEQQFADVKKTLDVAGDADEVEKAFDNIAKQLRSIAKNSPAAVSELTQIAAVGGQLGINAEEIVKFTDTIQKLTVATNLSAEQAALSLARLQKITNLTANEVDNLASVVVKLGNNFATTESEIITAATQIATATAGLQTAFNNPAVDALAFATTLRAVGQPAQAGSTAIIRLIQVIDQLVKSGAPQLERVATVAGLTQEAFVQMFDIDPSMTIARFIEGLGAAEERGEDVVAILNELGLGQIRSRRAFLALARARDDTTEGQGLLTSALEMANKEFVENNALTTEAERRYETVASQVQILKNRLNETALVYGDKLLPATNAIVQSFLNLSAAGDDQLGTFQKIAIFAGALGTAFLPFYGVRNVFRTLTRDTLEYNAALQLSRTGVMSLNAEEQRLLFTQTRNVKQRLFLAQKPLRNFLKPGLRVTPADPVDLFFGTVGDAGIGDSVQRQGRIMSIFNNNMKTSIGTIKKMAAANNQGVISFLASNKVFGNAGPFIDKMESSLRIFNNTQKQAIPMTGQFKGALIGLNTAANALKITLVNLAKGVMRIVAPLLIFQGIFSFFEKMGAKNRAMEEFASGLTQIGEGVQELEKTKADIEALKILEEDLMQKGAADKVVEEVKDMRKNLEETLTGKTQIINRNAGDILQNLLFANEESLEHQLDRTAMVLNKSPEIFAKNFFQGMSAIVTDIHTGKRPSVGDFAEAFVESDFGNQKINKALREIQDTVGLVDFINEVFPAMEMDELEGGLPNPFFEFFNNVETYMGGDPSQRFDRFFREASTARRRLKGDVFGFIGEEFKEAVAGLDDDELLGLLEILNAFGDSIELIADTKLEDITDRQILEQGSILLQAKAEFLNRQQDLLEGAGKLKTEDMIDATDIKNFSAAQKLVSKLLTENFGQVSQSQKDLKDELGITDEMILGIGETIDNELAKSLQNAINGFEKLPETARTTAQRFIKTLQDNLKIQETFSETVKELSVLFPLLALELAKGGTKNTELAKEFLERPFLAALAEGELLESVGPELANQARAALQETLQSDEFDEVEEIGISLGEGVVQGIESSKEDIEDIFSEVLVGAIEKARESIDVQNPSMMAFRRLGVPMIDGVIAGIKSKEKDLQKQFSETLTFLFAEEDIIKELQKDFAIFTQLRDAERGITRVKANRIKTEQALNAALRSQASINDRLAEAMRKNARLEIEGRAGVITLDEEISLLRSKIQLEEKIEAAEGKKSAKQLLAIQKAEENIQDLRAMADKGVISNLELQVAEEELSELKGEDVTDDERKLMILELAQMERDLNRAKEEALRQDKELVSSREEIIRLKEEQELVDINVANAINDVAAAKEREVDADLKLEEARNNFNKEIASGTLINSLKIVAQNYDAVTDSINKVLTQGAKLGELTTPLTDVIAGAAAASILLETANDSMGATKEAVDTIIEKIDPLVRTPRELEFRSQYEGQSPPNSFFERGVPGGGRAPETSLERLLRFLSNIPPGMGMGGRVKGYKHGGRVDPMRRALVGEYGPEEVKFIPGNGFLVKPLSTGSSGTVVNNLNVNVTGVPQDPISARKAAVQISKALKKLDKEGSSGTGLRRN